MGTKYRKPSPLQYASIVERIRALWNVEAGCYNEGVSDAAIAEELAVPKESVGNLRRQLYPPARPGKPPTPDELTARIVELGALANDLGVAFTKSQGEVSALEDRLGELERQVNRLQHRLTEGAPIAGDYDLSGTIARIEQQVKSFAEWKKDLEGPVQNGRAR